MPEALRGIFLAACFLGCAYGHEVAVTIDDLPRGGDIDGRCNFETLKEFTPRFLEVFRAQKVPVTAFAIAGLCLNLSGEQLRTILNLWMSAGVNLGNHTFSHQGLNTASLAEYEADILKADAVLLPMLASRGQKLRYFRHPMLQAGTTLEIKRGLERFLDDHGYRVAPVTFDNSDWMFAAVYGAALERNDRPMQEKVLRAYVPYLFSVFDFFERRIVEVTGHDAPQVLLLHASELNTRSMPAILDAFQSRGYSFITLDQALRDPAYSLPEDYAGRGGFSWIHRWSKTKGMPPKGEPDEPEWIQAEFNRLKRAAAPAR